MDADEQIAALCGHTSVEDAHALILVASGQHDDDAVFLELFLEIKVELPCEVGLIVLGNGRALVVLADVARVEADDDLVITGIARYRSVTLDALDIAGLAAALCDENDLDGLESLCHACGSCELTVLCPVEPAEILAVYSVVDIIVVGNFAGQLDLDALEPLGLAVRARQFAVGPPVLPADVLYVCCVLDAAGILGAYIVDVDAFKSSALAGRT